MTESFRAITHRVSKHGSQSLTHSYQLYKEGLISRAAMVDTSTALLENTARQAAAYSRTAYESYVAELTRELPNMLNVASVPAVTDKAGIRQAINTIIDGEADQIERRLQRLGSSVGIDEVQTSWGDELEADHRVDGWTRGLEPNACELCVYWYRDGRIWPKTHRMPVHKGCTCQQIPTVTTESIQPISPRQQRRIAAERRRIERE